MPEPSATPAGCVTAGKLPALSVLGVSSSGNESVAGGEGRSICWESTTGPVPGGAL